MNLMQRNNFMVMITGIGDFVQYKRSYLKKYSWSWAVLNRPMRSLVYSKYYTQIAFEWEILWIFFRDNNVANNGFGSFVFDCRQDKGQLDKTTGKWTGAVGYVREGAIYYH